VTVVIILRDCIVARAVGGWPKGLIMPWPADLPLMDGFVWLRSSVMTVGARGEPVVTWGDFTPEAQQVFREVGG
jgi:hypothetical protein